MILIGDVHGRFDLYRKIIEKHEKSIQLGDFGIGFPVKYNYGPYSNGKPARYTNYVPPKGHDFIRGNHDNPEKCRKNVRYLGDFGLLENDIFFISGAWSIDKNWRTPGVDWWKDEELSYKDMKKCIHLYEKIKPETVISHDCPMEIIELMYPLKVIKNSTSTAMQEMLNIHKPKRWYFGHHHKSFVINKNDVRYQCLNELEVVEI